MRKLVLGMLLAAGATLPTMAIAQEDGHRPDNPRKWADSRGEPRVDAGHVDHPRAAPQPAAQPRPQPQPAPQAQAQAQGRVDGRGDGGARFNGGARFDGGGRPGWGGPDRAAQAQQARAQQAQAQQAQAQQAQAAAQARAQAQAQDQARGRRADGFGQRPGYPGAGFDQGRPPQPGYRGPQGGAGGYQRPQDYGRTQAAPYQSGNGYRGGYQADNRSGGNWNRGWRDDRRYDWGRYRAQNRSAFHLQRYYAPGGWNYGYRRFSPGITLSAVLFGEGYWIDDPFDYRLPPAYGPYRWVRYYNDALLVDVRSGYVVDTVYDIFW